MNVARRAKAMLVDPLAEWTLIEQEPGDPAFVLTRYVAVLGLIPALFGFLGTSIIGVIVPGAGTVRAGDTSHVLSNAQVASIQH